MQNFTLGMCQQEVDWVADSKRHGRVNDVIQNITLSLQSSPSSHWSSPYDNDDKYRLFFDLVCRALRRDEPRHVLIVRESGVGEQAALIELARRGLLGQPPFLIRKQFVFVDCRHMVFKQSESILDTICLGSEADEGKILCLIGMPEIWRASTNVQGGKAFLTSIFFRTRSRVIATISPSEYDELFGAALQPCSLFSVINLHEPDLTTAIKIVSHFSTGLEKRYDLKIDGDAVERSVTLSDSFILHERLPAKAIGVLKSVCDDIDYNRSQNGNTETIITQQHVLAKLSDLTGIPISTLAGTGEEVDYRASFAEMIVGQTHAIEEMATELGLIKAGMVDSNKPATVMMFVGQTGTGKTEMAKVLARLYSSSKRLKTFTLGNFSEPHSVSGIIGVPPGYVGHDRGGRLINELNADPYSVFLLDEADKAHPDVMQPFLNLFDEGWVADQNGTRAYANRAIFILTTNIGQRQIADMCKNNKSLEEITAAMKESLSRIRHTKSNRPVFSAEFLARIKRLVVFRSLDEEAMCGIAVRRVAEMKKEWLIKRKKELYVPDSLIRAIGRRAYSIDKKSDGREGGRIVQKLFADVVDSRIQEAISKSMKAYHEAGRVQVNYLQSGETEVFDISRGSISITFA